MVRLPKLSPYQPVNQEKQKPRNKENHNKKNRGKQMNLTMSIFILHLSLIISFSLFPSHIIADAGKGSASAGGKGGGSSHDHDLIVCASAANKDLCQQTINADTKTPKKDINDLAYITFEAASTKTISNIEYITRTSDNAETGDGSVKQIFLDCEQQYEGAVDDVDNAVNYLASRSKEDDKQIDGLLKDAISAVDACQKNIVGKTGLKGEQLAKMNQELLDLLHNAQAVFHGIKQ